ncbi:MAG: hypothetical protein ABIO55_09325 [Ginsengibacter sp.]
MAKSNDFGVGLMHETAITASKVGWEPEDISSLSKDENLMKLIRGVILGTHEIKEIAYVIDCDAPPFIPEGWQVEQHKQRGNMRFEASKIELHCSKNKKGGSTDGYYVREDLKDKEALNANVLDYLLVNTKAIPDAWKDKDIFFWGTIYSSPKGYLHVRCLYWCDGLWRWGHDRLGVDWSIHKLAAILVT